MSDMTPLPDFKQFRKAVEALRKMDVRPKCSNHEPKSELVQFEEGGVSVKTHCANCGFLMYTHPDSEIGKKLVQEFEQGVEAEQ